MKNALSRWRCLEHPFAPPLAPPKAGREPHFFAFLGKIKNPDFRWKSGFYVVLLFFAVVPPGIEPGTQGFSVLCSTNWAMAPALYASCLKASANIGCFFLLCKFFAKKNSSKAKFTLPVLTNLIYHNKFIGPIGFFRDFFVPCRKYVLLWIGLLASRTKNRW